MQSGGTPTAKRRGIFQCPLATDISQPIFRFGHSNRLASLASWEEEQRRDYVNGVRKP